MDRTVLERLIAEDEHGLLAEKRRVSTAKSGEQRVAEKFGEIQRFVDREGREPDPDASDGLESTLGRRLKAIRAKAELVSALLPHDDTGLLDEARQRLDELAEPPQSIAEALARDTEGLIGGSDDDLFTLRHVPADKQAPEMVARREPCPDFEAFEGLLQSCQEDIRKGLRKVEVFKQAVRVEQGNFYVQKGVLLYVAEVGDITIKSGQPDARLRCIYENGTQSRLLMRSLAKALGEDGRLVTQRADSPPSGLVAPANAEKATIYVVRSLSEDPRLAQWPEVYKIGSTKQSVTARTATAVTSATFLGAPVEVVSEYNVAASQRLTIEKLLHTFFQSARLDIWFESPDGAVVAEAHEWFAVPATAIEEAVDLIGAGTIGEFEYDRVDETIRLARQ